MNDSAKCPRCGALLASDLPEGLCPRCLAALPFGPETAFTGQGAAASQPPLRPEELAPHFPQLEILECLGRGGMGVVYKARQKSLGRLVALKLLAPEREKDPQFSARFSQEAQALAQLDHPHIVTVYDFGQSGGFFYLLMEYVDGVNLRQLMEARKLSPEEALTIVPPLCEALQFAHERGIVHRDIKPENLLLAKDGRVKIADFGIARMMGSTAAAADEEKAAGTPGYMAPEQMNAPTQADNRVDIYSLGVVFYEMLTGELPGERFQRPSRKVGVDVRIDEIVLRALEKEPALRYQTANDVRAAVTSVLESQGAPPPPIANAPVPHDPWPRRVLWTLALVIGLPVLMIFVGLLVPYILLGHDRSAVSSLIGWLIAGGVGVVWLVVLIGFIGSWRRQKAGASALQRPGSRWVPVVWAIAGLIAIPNLLVMLGLALPALQRARQHAAHTVAEAQSRQAAIASELGNPVPQSRFVTVGGAVHTPQAVPWTEDLTLSAAIMRAGGPTAFGNLKRVRITRNGEDSVFNLREAKDNPSQDPKLLPSDQVVVPE